MTDTEYFNDAFMAYCWRKNFDGRFCELSIEDQMSVLRDAQILKDAGRITGEAVQSFAQRPLYEGEPQLHMHECQCGHRFVKAEGGNTCPKCGRDWN